MYAVVLAGGGGTRLWPLSRPETPKPFLPLVGERSLLQRTVDRLSGPELAIAPQDVVVVTDRRYAALVRAQLPKARVVEEPMGRNTAAAIALATVAVERPDDEVMVVLPADQTIADEAAFRRAVRLAGRLAGGAFGVESPLVTLGIRPDRPATDYGYLRADAASSTVMDGLATGALRGFEEKPSADRARALLEEGASWNAGVFVWQRCAIREALERYTGLVTLLEPVVGRDATALPAAYDRLTPISIDYAVMEGAARDHRVLTVAMDVGWSDLGSWTALLAAIGAAGQGRVVQPGESADAGPDDLVVERVDGRLAVARGPRGILAQHPVALLSGAAAARMAVDDLVRRVSSWEDRT